MRLGLWRLASRRKRRFRQMLPPLGLGEPFPVFFGMQTGLLATEERIGAAPLSVVHDFLPLTSRIWLRDIAVACNAILAEMLQLLVCWIKDDSSGAIKKAAG